MRDLVKLICTDCKRENYYTDKNKKRTSVRLELKKYCFFTRTHTLHREKK
ncbi:50S ribosomal protein L33 ['Fragaria x ananassa' phyllody phytoplasma]|uniref:Large ribosomal subunit protein bL33 n=1 Tax='Fragaria x ananassa' phyllody phytoplasma TaxID=2358428 RepID=A0ABS5K4Y2_9MOLU|nr:50S ribosomal protein L33 ['Fragaria x ananassa' phyllody phytoplasma]MBS2126343.1 50S ribosomal protein L33 ['Fragaria x ananassa' phyllody phytoplasma]